MRHQHKGGIYGHCYRRLTHIGMVFVPILYYWYGHTLGAMFGVSRGTLVKIIVLLIFCGEWLRVKRGWVVLGQRSYEARQLSAFAWGSLGTAIVLLTVPEIGLQGAGLGFPIIASLALVDPLLGELRGVKASKVLLIVFGFIGLLIIWLCACYWLQTPIWVLIFVIPTSLLAEIYKISNIDDNFLMLIVPLIIVLILSNFVGF